MTHQSSTPPTPPRAGLVKRCVIGAMAVLTERSINILKSFPRLKKVEIGPFPNRSEEDWSAIQEKLDVLQLEDAWYRSN
jgi:hypothetical protein